jgi:hypothetical protein
MKVRDLVELFGGQSALGALVGINQSAVAYWVKKGAIPTKWHSQILSIAIDKKITLDASDLIARPELRPVSTSGGRAIHKLGTSPTTEKINQFSDQLAAQTSPFIFYASTNGDVKIQVLIGDETVWASQRGMADIFDVSVPTINEHLNNIFGTNELDPSTTIRNFLTVADNGGEYNVKFYNLDAVISVGYRVNSHRATQFRVWATGVLKEYLIKGYALDDDKLKQGSALFGKDYFEELLERIRKIRASERRFYQKITDIYAQCSVDYDPNSPTTQQFYAHVQDKLHYAIHGHTAAEIIGIRADAHKPNMGLTHWKNEGKSGHITKSDVTVGKNYLSKNELEELERLVSMYLDFAENTARRQKLMTMTDWSKRLNDFLEFNDYKVLENFGAVSRERSERHAVHEYEKFRIVQDKTYKSDFDRVVDEVKITKKLPKR